MTVTLIALASLLFMGCCAMLPAPDFDATEEQILFDCILKMIKSYFDTQLPVAVQTPEMWIKPRRLQSPRGETFLKMLSTQSDIPQITLGMPDDNLYKKNHNKVRPGSFLFFISCLNPDKGLNLDNAMKLRTSKDSRNTEGLVIVAVMEPFHNVRLRNSTIISLLELCQLYHFVNCVVLVPRATVGAVDVFTRSHKYCLSENELKMVLMDTWIAKENKFLAGVDLFPLDLKLDFKGCRLTVYFAIPSFPLVFTVRETFEGPGFEVLLIFCKMFNCSLSPNVHREPDIVFPIVYTDDYVMEDFGLSYPHFLESYTWFVPSGSKFPRWKVIFRVFSPLLSLFVFLTGILGTLTLWLLIKPSARVGKVGYSVMASLLTHLGVCATDYFQGPLSTAFFTLWLFYCLLINTAYQSGLFTLMVDPGEHAPVETFAELEKSGLHMTSILNFRINTSYSTEVLSKYELLKCLDGKYYCFQEVARSKSRAMLFHKDVGIEYARYFKDRLGKLQVFHLKDSFVTMNFAFHVPLTFAIMRPLNRLVSIAVDSGIVDRCMRQAFRDFVLFFPHNNQPETEKVFAFTIGHLQGPFYLLMTGLSVSALTYFLEIFYYWFQRRLFLV